jgi:hypothetical protein
MIGENGSSDDQLAAEIRRTNADEKTTITQQVILHDESRVVILGVFEQT